MKKKTKNKNKTKTSKQNNDNNNNNNNMIHIVQLVTMASSLLYWNIPGYTNVTRFDFRGERYMYTVFEVSDTTT